MTGLAMSLSIDGSVVRILMTPRGRTLTDAEIRRWNDFLFTLLINHANLSVPDAIAVMQRSIGERQIRNRINQTGPAVKKIGLVGMLVELTRQCHSGREVG